MSEQEGTVLQIDPTLLAVVGGLLVPLLVSVVTRLTASPGLKAVVNLFLSAVAGGIAAATTANGSVVWKQWAFSMAITWVISVATYYGFWRPTTVAPRLAQASRNFGLGPALPRSVGAAFNTAGWWTTDGWTANSSGNTANTANVTINWTPQPPAIEGDAPDA